VQQVRSGQGVGRDHRRAWELVKQSRGDVINFDGESRLTFIEAPLKTLFTTWVFDDRSRVLFTSDALGFPAGERDARELRRYLLARHDWIAHADTDALIERIDRCFDVYEVEVVAPATGAPVVGRAAVQELREAVTAAIAVRQPVRAFRRPRGASGGDGGRVAAPGPAEDAGVR
jgi:flavorubredoxin